jgi:hypothetical protein
VTIGSVSAVLTTLEPARGAPSGIG